MLGISSLDRHVENPDIPEIGCGSRTHKVVAECLGVGISHGFEVSGWSHDRQVVPELPGTHVLHEIDVVHRGHASPLLRDRCPVKRPRPSINHSDQRCDIHDCHGHELERPEAREQLLHGLDNAHRIVQGLAGLTNGDRRVTQGRILGVVPTQPHRPERAYDAGGTPQLSLNGLLGRLVGADLRACVRCRSPCLARVAVSAFLAAS